MLKIVRNLALLAVMIAYVAIPRPAKATTCVCDYCGADYQACAASCNGDSDCLNACSSSMYSCYYWCYYPCVYG